MAAVAPALACHLQQAVERGSGCRHATTDCPHTRAVHTAPARTHSDAQVQLRRSMRGPRHRQCGNRTVGACSRLHSTPNDRGEPSPSFGFATCFKRKMTDVPTATPAVSNVAVGSPSTAPSTVMATRAGGMPSFAANASASAATDADAPSVTSTRFFPCTPTMASTYRSASDNSSGNEQRVRVGRDNRGGGGNTQSSREGSAVYCTRAACGPSLCPAAAAAAAKMKTCGAAAGRPSASTAATMMTPGATQILPQAAPPTRRRTRPSRASSPPRAPSCRAARAAAEEVDTECKGRHRWRTWSGRGANGGSWHASGQARAHCVATARRFRMRSMRQAAHHRRRPA